MFEKNLFKKRIKSPFDQITNVFSQVSQYQNKNVMKMLVHMPYKSKTNLYIFKLKFYNTNKNKYSYTKYHEISSLNPRIKKPGYSSSTLCSSNNRKKIHFLELSLLCYITYIDIAIGGYACFFLLSYLPD